MKFCPKQLHSKFEEYSLAHRVGMVAIMLFLFVLPHSYTLAALPLLIFIVFCFTAPFLPGFSFFLPVVSRGRSDRGGVALTFDDGPDPESTPNLLTLLAQYNVPATFYVTGHRAEQFPHLIREIVAHGHTIGNHTYSHDNFIMFKTQAALKKEIQKAQEVFEQLGLFPCTFRPPVGVTSPKLNNVLISLKMYVVNFSRRAGDRGNRQVTHLSQKILKRLRPGDIIMLHDIPVRQKKMDRHWLVEVEHMLNGIADMNLKILPLDVLIDRPVMADPGPAPRCTSGSQG
jgi:peptidoglycan/xylan/chitin deacetylase (PgdA/CDA1 family)